MSTESMFTTAAITASKGRYVRCYNVPSVFVNMGMDKDVVMVTSGDDGAHCTSDILQAHHRGWERITCPLHLATKSSTQADESQLAVLPKVAERAGR